MKIRAGAAARWRARGRSPPIPTAHLFYCNTAARRHSRGVQEPGATIRSRTMRRSPASRRASTIWSWHPAFPARSIQDFLAYARVHPGALNYAMAVPAT